MPDARYKIRNSSIVCMLDVSLAIASFWLAFWLRFKVEFLRGLLHYGRFPVPPISYYLRAMSLVIFLQLILFYFNGLYFRRDSMDTVEEVNRTWKTVAFCTILIISLTFFYRDREFTYSRLVFIFMFFINAFLIAFARVVFKIVEGKPRMKGKNVRRIILVGRGEMAALFAEKALANPAYGYVVMGAVAVEDEYFEGTPSLLGELADFKKIIKKRDPDEVIICHPGIHHYKLLEIIDCCEQQSIQVRFVPTVYDLLIDTSDVANLMGLPIVGLAEATQSVVHVVAKRIFDVVATLILSPVVLVFAAGIATLIYFEDKGPVLFKQRRAGRWGDSFTMYKFRTMIVEAESKLEETVNFDELEEPVFKLADDPRVTRIGRRLRRTSLDELPQLWNVLKGEMSLVGPRPEQVDLTLRYNIWQKRRLKVKPGITGLQQVNCRGTLSLAERVKYDIYYIRRQSILLDMLIILKTFYVVATGKGAS